MEHFDGLADVDADADLLFDGEDLEEALVGEVDAVDALHEEVPAQLQTEAAHLPQPVDVHGRLDDVVALQEAADVVFIGDVAHLGRVGDVAQLAAVEACALVPQELVQPVADGLDAEVLAGEAAVVEDALRAVGKDLADGIGGVLVIQRLELLVQLGVQRQGRHGQMQVHVVQDLLGQDDGRGLREAVGRRRDLREAGKGRAWNAADGGRVAARRLVGGAVAEHFL